MKLKRMFLASLIVCFSLLATGCGDKLYTMTAAEETTIALYAAKMVTKFNKNQTTGICNARIRDGELDDPEEVVEGEEEDITEITDGEANQKPAENTGLTLSEAIGIEGMDFSCLSIDCTEEYQVNESFILTKVNGKDYMVSYIYGTNVSEEAIDFSTLEPRSYRLAINNSAFSEAQNTFSDYDLSFFDGVVNPGDTVSFILVFQVNSSSVSEDSNLELEVTSAEETRIASLNINQL